MSLKDHTVVLCKWERDPIVSTTTSRDTCCDMMFTFDREVISIVTDFLLGSKVTADGDCSLEIKRCLLLGRKSMTNLDSILKSRDITFPTKVHLVKATVFPVVMYGCESWTIRKSEH